ncbi:MAG TPA: DUF1134 domain-containing protein [Rhizomicrobium sp.]|jgi:hypothetical protein
MAFGRTLGALVFVFASFAPAFAQDDDDNGPPPSDSSQIDRQNLPPPGQDQPPPPRHSSGRPRDLTGGSSTYNDNPGSDSQPPPQQAYDTPPPPPPDRDGYSDRDADDAPPADDRVADEPPPREQHDDDTFNQDEIVGAASNFFGVTTEAVAKAVQRIFRDNGLPDGYIKGDEGSGAFVVGARYGSGYLIRKGYRPVKVFWKGPSVGFDFGGNASKVFTLVYNLKEERRLWQRFPGVEGQIYFVAGIGVNYERSGGVTLAPMRTGVGLRAGVNAQYQVYTPKRDWFPL